MKNALLFFVSLSFLFGCGSSDVAEKVMANASTSMKIDGMTCQEMCASRIEEKIARMSGVKSCVVDFENEMATLIYDEKTLEIDEVVLKIEDMSDGKYTVSEMNTEKITNTNSEVNSGGGSETGKIMTAPSFELPNLADYLRNIL